MKDDQIFHNLNKTSPKGLLDIIKWKLNSKQPKWPKEVPLETFDLPPARVNDQRVRISFIGHVTFLIQTDGINILTDPVWSERASPLSFAGPKRVTMPGINFDDLPKIDIVLISHNHYDHMDIATIRRLWQRDRPQIITPLMNNIVLEKHISEIEVKTLNWGEKILLQGQQEICLETAQHWSARGIFDQNEALWGTFIIKTRNGDICFIGDSGYCPKLFKDIAKNYNDILVSLIPIGAFEPRWMMHDVHMNPDEAILTHLDLKSKYSIGSHFATFQLADDKFDQPALELDQARRKHNISDQTFITPKIGKAYWFDKTAN